MGCDDLACLSLYLGNTFFAVQLSIVSNVLCNAKKQMLNCAARSTRVANQSLDCVVIENSSRVAEDLTCRLLVTQRVQ